MSDRTPSSSSAPIYADRNSGEKFADATRMVNAYLARFAEGHGHREKATLDETGYAQLQRGSATIGINVLEDQGVLMVFSPVMQIPVTGHEPFFRRLLELSFVTTSDAAFAINSHQNEVVVRSLRRLSALDYEEFEDIVRTIGEVADHWDDKLIKEFGT